MLTSKQRAKLKGLASRQPAILQVGKGELSDTVIRQAEDALTARELIKGTVLQNCDTDVRNVAEKLAEATESQVVHCIGRRFVLYRENPEKRQIQLN